MKCDIHVGPCRCTHGRAAKPKQLCTVREAAIRLGVTVCDIEDQIADGRLTEYTVYAPNNRKWTAVWVEQRR